MDDGHDGIGEGRGGDRAGRDHQQQRHPVVEDGGERPQLVGDREVACGAVSTTYAVPCRERRDDRRGGRRRLAFEPDRVLLRRDPRERLGRGDQVVAEAAADPRQLAQLVLPVQHRLDGRDAHGLQRREPEGLGRGLFQCLERHRRQRGSHRRCPHRRDRRDHGVAGAGLRACRGPEVGHRPRQLAEPGAVQQAWLRRGPGRRGEPEPRVEEVVDGQLGGVDLAGRLSQPVQHPGELCLQAPREELAQVGGVRAQLLAALARREHPPHRGEHPGRLHRGRRPIGELREPRRLLRPRLREVHAGDEGAEQRLGVVPRQQHHPPRHVAGAGDRHLARGKGGEQATYLLVGGGLPVLRKACLVDPHCHRSGGVAGLASYLLVHRVRVPRHAGTVSCDRPTGPDPGPVVHLAWFLRTRPEVFRLNLLVCRSHGRAEALGSAQIGLGEETVVGTWGEAYLTRLRGCAVRMERELVEISDRDRAVRLIESEARTVEEGFGEGLLAMESASRVRTLDPLQSSAWLVAGDPARARWESLPQLAAYVELLQAGYPEGALRFETPTVSWRSIWPRSTTTARSCCSASPARSRWSSPSSRHWCRPSRSGTCARCATSRVGRRSSSPTSCGARVRRTSGWSRPVPGGCSGCGTAAPSS